MLVWCVLDMCHALRIRALKYIGFGLVNPGPFSPVHFGWCPGATAMEELVRVCHEGVCTISLEVQFDSILTG